MTWKRFQTHYRYFPSLGLGLDISRMNFQESIFEDEKENIGRALEEMRRIEKGDEVNVDENRRVGHYWLRAPELAPEEFRKPIGDELKKIKDFVRKVRKEQRFQNLLLIGIGGSALGPQLVAEALGQPGDPMRLFSLDNTDPDGIDRVLRTIGDGLGETLSIVISKSGGTVETKNGMILARKAYGDRGLDFEKHAVAVTVEGSGLDGTAKKWLERFYIWDWVGGRTSELSAVGLLPAALQGFDIDDLLAGARAMDVETRVADARKNPAALLALMWLSTGWKKKKDMVILPYRDRLLLFSRYLQQLVMESLGKELDRDGNRVHQGIAVYGNKGSTDQHAFVQQLRDGLDNFFVTFIEVERENSSMAAMEQVKPGFTAGDYLSGFLRGTRKALSEKGRESITIELEQLDARGLGMLIALFERAVGLYAGLVNINAYHQPGVQAGKVAAEDVLDLQGKVLEILREQPGEGNARGVDQIARALGEKLAEDIFHILKRLSANPERTGVRRQGDDPTRAKYYV